MRNRWLASLVGFWLSAGSALGQPPAGKMDKLPPPEPGKDKSADKGKSVPPRPADDGPPALRDASWVPWGEGHPWCSGEFLLMWIKNTREVPPIITGPPIIDATSGAVVGRSVLVGNRPLDYDTFAGLRVRGGYWFDAERCLGVETSFLVLGKRSFGFRMDDLPTLGRPFFDLNTRTEENIVIAQPGIAAGGVAFQTTSRTWGLEANVWQNLYYEPIFKCVRADLLYGFRYLDLAEDIRLERATTFNPDLAAVPQFLGLQSNRLLESDSIRGHNHFYGPQAGLSVKVFGDHLVLDMNAKVAMGVNDEHLSLRGQQLRIRPNGVRTTSPGALWALPSNIGNYERDQFAWIPEININLGIPLGNHVGVYLGYNFIYWNQVVRAGEQIDRVVDTIQIPSFPPPVAAATGQGRPSVLFTQSHWWAQGITFGLEFSW